MKDDCALGDSRIAGASNVIHYGFDPALRRERLRVIRVHESRYTAASLLHANGVDVIAVSRPVRSLIANRDAYGVLARNSVERAGLTDSPQA